MSLVRIILYVLILIMNGLSKKEAATRASSLFGVSVEEILKYF